MASIAGANALYTPYRNSVIGKTSDYSGRVDTDTDILFGFFSDDGSVTPDDTNTFHTNATNNGASENPTFANCTANPGSRLTAVTVGTVAAGVVDAADFVFTGSVVLTGATSVESYIIAKFVTNRADSPVLAHFGSATGLPLTPNGADVTCVYNASGIWRF
jgi:hypothetical protein